MCAFHALLLCGRLSPAWWPAVTIMPSAQRFACIGIRLGSFNATTARKEKPAAC
jgi:hypothetical protein